MSDEWNVSKYNLLNSEQLEFLSTRRGYEYVKKMEGEYRHIMPKELGDAFEKVVKDLEHWQIAVSLASGITPDVVALSSKTGFSEATVTNILNNMGELEIIAILESSNPYRLCTRYCENSPDPNCFKKCIDMFRNLADEK